MADLQPYQQRVLEEKAELDERLRKLIAFLRSPDANRANPEERDWMISQGYAMRAYSKALEERIKTY